MRNRFGVLIASAGAVLLIVTGVGQWTHFGHYESAAPRKWERFDPSLATNTRSLSDLSATAQAQFSASASEQEIMEVLYTTVADRFTHQEARHTFSSNWVAYLAGQLHPVFLHIWDPELMIAKGHSLLCDQSSYLLLSLARANGVKARHVGLHGHVVMEAWYDSDWHLYDPDMEVVPVDSEGRVLSVEELATNSELLEHYYGPHGIAVDIVKTRDNNTYMSYPEGSRFEWKSNVLVYVERVMEFLKFALPITAIVLGIFLILTRRTSKVASARWSASWDSGEAPGPGPLLP